MTIIRPRTHHERPRYDRVFWFRGYEGCWGFSFPCTADGVLLDPPAAAVAHYQACLTGLVDGHPVVDGGVRRWTDRWTAPTVGLCVCGATVALLGFTNTCEACGRDYNLSGQLLASRLQWGAETGESLADILSVDGSAPALG